MEDLGTVPFEGQVRKQGPCRLGRNEVGKVRWLPVMEMLPFPPTCNRRIKIEVFSIPRKLLGLFFFFFFLVQKNLERLSLPMAVCGPSTGRGEAAWREAAVYTQVCLGVVRERVSGSLH